VKSSTVFWLVVAYLVVRHTAEQAAKKEAVDDAKALLDKAKSIVLP
jgi:hypothetical protein